MRTTAGTQNLSRRRPDAFARLVRLITAFQQLKASGVTILLVEQNINFAKRLGDRVAVMDDGRVVHAGAMQALAEDEVLQQSLLGLAL